MSRWFRMYDEILDDPKVQLLDAPLFKMWVNMLALCSRNGGKLPSINETAFALRETEQSVSSAFHMLADVGLVVTDGETFQPWNWKKRQYKSDTSTKRVQEFRKRSRNVSETPRARSETDTDSVDKSTVASDVEFWDSAKAFLAGESKNPGAVIGKWCRDYTKPRTAEAITKAQLERPVQRIPFITATLKGMAKAQAPPVWDFMP